MSVFRFKQFSVDQSGCAMKINTDGVLLGALAEAKSPGRILDIGTGTGVIALMLAQRYANARIDAVEIDNVAAATAQRNFSESPFSDRLSVYDQHFAQFLADNIGNRYDLIVSNPPFYLDALTSPEDSVNQAKHADRDFFSGLINAIAKHLSTDGTCWLVLPLNTAEFVKALLAANRMYLQKVIAIKSFTDSEPHREMLIIGRRAEASFNQDFVIYSAPKVYSEQYIAALKDFFIVF